MDVNPAGLALYGQPTRSSAMTFRAHAEGLRALPAGHGPPRAGRSQHARRDHGAAPERQHLRGRPARHALSRTAAARTPWRCCATSERRQRERELHCEEQYRAIFNASVDAMVLRSADFSIVDVNATYEAWTGYSAPKSSA